MRAQDDCQGCDEEWLEELLRDIKDDSQPPPFPPTDSSGGSECGNRVHSNSSDQESRETDHGEKGGARSRSSPQGDVSAPSTASGDACIVQSCCWGAELKALKGSEQELCDPMFVRRKGHFQNKFCSRCRVLGFSLPLPHVQALSTSLKQQLLTSTPTSGFWSHFLHGGHVLKFRIANHVARCRGVTIAIFQTPPPPLDWAPLPTEWLSHEKDTIDLVVAYGALVPMSTMTHAHGPQIQYKMDEIARQARFAQHQLLTRVSAVAVLPAVPSTTIGGEYGVMISSACSLPMEYQSTTTMPPSQVSLALATVLGKRGAGLGGHALKPPKRQATGQKTATAQTSATPPSSLLSSFLPASFLPATLGIRGLILGQPGAVVGEPAGSAAYSGPQPASTTPARVTADELPSACVKSITQPMPSPPASPPDANGIMSHGESGLSSALVTICPLSLRLGLTSKSYLVAVFAGAAISSLVDAMILEISIADGSQGSSTIHFPLVLIAAALLFLGYSTVSRRFSTNTIAIVCGCILVPAIALCITLVQCITNPTSPSYSLWLHPSPSNRAVHHKFEQHEPLIRFLLAYDYYIRDYFIITFAFGMATSAMPCSFAWKAAVLVCFLSGMLIPLTVSTVRLEESIGFLYMLFLNRAVPMLFGFAVMHSEVSFSLRSGISVFSKRHATKTWPRAPGPRPAHRSRETGFMRSSARPNSTGHRYSLVHTRDTRHHGAV